MPVHFGSGQHQQAILVEQVEADDPIGHDRADTGIEPIHEADGLGPYISPTSVIELGIEVHTCPMKSLLELRNDTSQNQLVCAGRIEEANPVILLASDAGFGVTGNAVKDEENEEENSHLCQA